jgi:hypothetical protein
MNFETVIGILGVVAIAMCWALAVVLFRVGPADGVARKLSVVLVIEGLALATAGFPEFAFDLGDDFFTRHAWLDPVLGTLHFLSDAGMIALYPPFLAAALGTALTRPFADKKPRIALAFIGVAVALGAVVGMALGGSTTGAAVLYIMVTLLFLFALIASLDAWRRANPGIARTRAGLFAVAFGIRDLFWCFVYAASFWMAATGRFSPEHALFWVTKVIYALGTLFAVPLIAYGILRAHLFDIDLRIRWTIKQSTLAGLIVAIIFLISEGVSTFLSAELGTMAGLFAAAVVMFFLTPLQRFADRVASSAMPNTKNTPEYVAFRKMQVYEAALVDALNEGGISNKERTLLGHLRESLGISEADAAAIEKELRSASGAELSAAGA